MGSPDLQSSFLLKKNIFLCFSHIVHDCNKAKHYTQSFNTKYHHRTLIS